ncbi:2,3-bisphosphoglycerate-independent phosphoglycerate mutase [Candidatus Microgenomates bacterium]|nr:2,3-bisphosphoglycerate-independent phosphoglycerate mutase [Candidatus Microgenomates bacterium]
MFNLFNFSKKKEAQVSGIKPVVLVVLDGWGLAPHSAGNAITQANTPNMNKYWATYPHGELLASGESVGLPANEVGNTEVGHLNLGAGRVVLQDLKRISKAVEDGSFFYNKALRDMVAHVKQHNSKLHIVGLVGSGHVHSSVEHLFATLDFAKKEGLQNVFLHLFTDGRDSPPKEGASIVAKVEEKLKSVNVGQIATIGGRYFGMDRDKRWERTQKAYEVMVLGRGVGAREAVEAIQNAYQKGQTDEFVEPTVIQTGEGKPTAVVDDNDALIFYNFRVDRPRQLTMAFVLPNFENLREFEFGYDPHTRRAEGKVKFEAPFTREKVLKNLFFVTMTEYQKNLPVSAVAFPPEVIEKPLVVVLSEKGLRQLHMAESEKERFVTYYFDGQREKQLPSEEVLIVPSPKVPTYDKKPEMSVAKLTDEFKKVISRGVYHFILVNIANPDMVAHSGNLKATIAGVEHADRALGEMVSEVLRMGGTVVVTADHGNAEELLTFPTTSYFVTTAKGEVNTDHSNNPVPVIVARADFEGKSHTFTRGILGDVAPTILALMGVAPPAEMTGKNLLQLT